MDADGVIFRDVKAMERVLAYGLPVVDAAALAVGAETHVAVVYDFAAGGVRLYANGQRVGTGPVTHPLSVVEDRNVYLGRSQWSDAYFVGDRDDRKQQRNQGCDSTHGCGIILSLEEMNLPDGSGAAQGPPRPVDLLNA